MKRALMPALVLASLAPAGRAEWSARSPANEVDITVALDAAGAAFYSVTQRGRPVVLPSRLGFETTAAPHLVAGFTVIGTRVTDHRGEWRPVYGERELISESYQERRIDLRHTPTGRALTLVLRAYPEGAALCYEFPANPAPEAAPLTLTAEHTEFRFPEGSLGYEEHGTEGEYARVPVGAIKPNCERPLTVELPDGRFACLVEAHLENYPRMLLSPSPLSAGALVSALSGRAIVDTRATFATPWRAFILGDRPGDLLERSYLVLNLNPPNALADTSWIKPGKAIREVSLSTPGGKACVDFAVAQGFRYVLYDAGWYGHEYDDAADARGVNLDPKRVGHVPNHPGLDLPEVIAYARSRGIGIFLYVNRRALERQLDELLPLYARWGVAGVKFGFVNVGPQAWTRWVHDAVRKAAAHRLLVDIHDSYRPTGFSRTYPNLLTQEGVRGNEHMPTATHNATLPFTRQPAGAADYTICVYDRRVKPTRAHQLALAVTGYSPLQLIYWYDRPAQFDGAPELAFFAAVPTVWHETRVLQDRIGAAVTIARRSGSEWFVGTITGDDPAGEHAPLSLGFLSPGKHYMARIYENDPADPRATRIRRERVDAGTRLTRSLPAAGGQAVHLSPE